MVKVLVIGYGNPLREDDGVGWRVVEEIERQQTEDRNHQSLLFNPSTSSGQVLQLFATHQLLPELAEEVSEAGLVIFVDASVEGEPGTVVVREIGPADMKMGAFTHHFDPAGLVGYARDLYGRFPRAYLVTVTAVSLGYGEGLSETVAGALPEVLRHIRKLIG